MEKDNDRDESRQIYVAADIVVAMLLGSLAGICAIALAAWLA